jgi:hypothetical protein
MKNLIYLCFFVFVISCAVTAPNLTDFYKPNDITSIVYENRDKLKKEITNIQNIKEILGFINSYQSAFNGKGVIKTKLLLINNQRDTTYLNASKKTICMSSFVYIYKENIYNTIDSINLKYLENIHN